MVARDCESHQRISIQHVVIAFLQSVARELERQLELFSILLAAILLAALRLH